MKVPEKGSFDVYKTISNKRSLAQVKNESRVWDVLEQIIYNLCESCGFEVLVCPFFSSFKGSQLSLEPRPGKTDRQSVRLGGVKGERTKEKGV